MTNKLSSFFKGGDPQRGQSRKDHLPDSFSQFFPDEPPHRCNHHGSLWLTFLKTIGSSSHTGLMALLFWEVLVFSAFLLVSAGSPNISTSTYTPTRRSVRNWPEITWYTDIKRVRRSIWQHRTAQFPLRCQLYTTVSITGTQIWPPDKQRWKGKPPFYQDETLSRLI